MRLRRAHPKAVLLRTQKPLRRGVFILPSIFTVSNIFCGYCSILATMRGDFDRAAVFIGVAIVMDILDGRVARLTHTDNGFGLQLDSLADVISFGVAPSLLVLSWGLGPTSYRLGFIAAFTYAICGAIRLARFNIQTGGPKHFLGLPIPAAGGTLAAIVHFFPEPLQAPLHALAMTGIMFGLACLMVSTVRYQTFKQVTLRRRSHLAILVLALSVALIYTYSQPTGLVLALGYTLSGPVHWFVSSVRGRSREAGLARRRRSRSLSTSLGDDPSSADLPTPKVHSTSERPVDLKFLDNRSSHD